MGIWKVQTKEIEGEKWIKFDRKYDEFRFKFGNILTLALIILLVAIMTYTAFNLETIKYQPFLYGARQQYKETGIDFTCKCSDGNVNGLVSEKIFYFNRTAIWNEDYTYTKD